MAKRKKSAKRYRRKRSFKRRRTGTKLASTIRRTVNRMEETKWVAGTAAVFASNAAMGLLLYNAPVRGLTRDLRVGCQISLRSVQYGIEVGANPTAVVATHVRLILLVDREPNGVAPLFTDIFADPAIGNAYLSMFNYNTVGKGKRIRIVKDMMFNLNLVAPNQAAAGAPNVSNLSRTVYKKLYKRLPMRIQFNDGNAGTIADISRNAVYLAFVSNQPGAVQPFLNIEHRVMFNDA